MEPISNKVKEAIGKMNSPDNDKKVIDITKQAVIKSFQNLSNEIMEEKVKLVLKTKGNLKSNIPKLTHSKSQRSHKTNKVTIISPVDSSVEMNPQRAKLRSKTERDLLAAEQNRITEEMKKKHSELKKQRMERDQRRQASLENLDKQKALEQEELKKKQEIQHAKSKNLHKDTVLTRYKSEIIAAEERQHIRKTSNENLQKVKEIQPLYQKMASEYEQEKVLPEINRSLEYLNQKRQSAMSFNKGALDDHEKRYLDMARESQYRRIHHWKVKRSEHKEAIEHSPESKYHELNAKEDQDRIDNERQRYDHKEQEFIRRMKRRKYGDMVAELYKPTISLAKQAEMVKSMERIQTVRRDISPRPPKSSARLIGHVTPPPRRRPLTTKRSTQFKTPEPESSAPSRPINYLQQLRDKRISDIQKSDVQLELETPNWQGILQNQHTSSTDKMYQIKDNAMRVEKLARLKEQSLIGLNSDQGKVVMDTHEAVDQIYIDSIKAKLAILDTLN